MRKFVAVAFAAAVVALSIAPTHAQQDKPDQKAVEAVTRDLDQLLKKYGIRGSVQQIQISPREDVKPQACSWQCWSCSSGQCCGIVCN